MNLVILNFDGACEPVNPGGWMTVAFILQSATGNREHCDIQEPHASSTNNVAEWYALGFGLRELLVFRDGQEPFDLCIRGDSQLVINQLNREWGCHKPHLGKLRDRCFELLEQAKAMGLVKWTAEWIPREQNDKADALGRAKYLEKTGKVMPDRIKTKARR